MHNEQQARKADYKIVWSGRPELPGPGQWKQVTPEALLHGAFANPASTVRQVASEGKVSWNYARDIQYAVAEKLHGLQTQAVADLLAQLSEDSILVLSLQFDETQFSLVAEGAPSKTKPGHGVWNLIVAMPNFTARAGRVARRMCSGVLGQPRRFSRALEAV